MQEVVGDTNTSQPTACVHDFYGCEVNTEYEPDLSQPHDGYEAVDPFMEDPADDSPEAPAADSAASNAEQAMQARRALPIDPYSGVCCP